MVFNAVHLYCVRAARVGRVDHYLLIACQRQAVVYVVCVSAAKVMMLERQHGASWHQYFIPLLTLGGRIRMHHHASLLGALWPSG